MRRFPALSHEALAKWGKYFLIAISFVFLFFILQKQVFAEYQITVTQDPNTQPSTDEADYYIFGDVYDYENNIVTENTQTVRIKFSGLMNDTEYYICLSKKCIDTITIGEPRFEAPDRTTTADGEITIDVCADGKSKLKIEDDGECDEEDYFWGGRIYLAAVVSKEDEEKDPIDLATFYVSHYYPDAYLLPVLGAQYKPGDPIDIQIRGNRRPFGDKYKKNRNNYAVEIARSDDIDKIYSQDCIVIPKDKGVTLKGREAGDYIIKISEQTNEGGLFKGRGGCTAGFTYYWLKIRVRSEDFWKDREYKSAEPKLNTSLVEIIPDPNGSDVPGSKKGKKIPPPPCTTNIRDLDGGTCPEVKTALGDIKTSPGEFVGSIFAIVLGLAGGLAIILIIFSGYRMIASQGNPEKLEEARQQLVSAIVGLLFLVFSLIILQVIGVDILKLDVLSGGAFGT